MPLDPDKDVFAARGRSAEGQARRAAAVTPDDDTDLDPYAKALYVGTSGDLVVLPVAADDAEPVTLVAHPIGYVPIQVRRVLETGTTADDIVALFD